MKKFDNEIVLANLSKYLTSQTAINTFAHSYLTLYPSHLSQNKNISKKIWHALYKQSNITQACDLLRHELDQNQINLLLKDNRISVQSLALQVVDLSNTPVKVIDKAITQKWFDPYHAKRWLKSGNCPKTFQEQVTNLALTSYTREELAHVKPRAQENTTVRIDTEQLLDLPIEYLYSSTRDLGTQIVESLQKELDAAGPEAYQIFFALLPSWEQNTRQLIQTAITLSTAPCLKQDMM